MRKMALLATAFMAVAALAFAAQAQGEGRGKSERQESEGRGEAKQGWMRHWDGDENPEVEEHFIRHTKARKEVKRLAAECRQAKGPEKETLKPKLEKAVAELFDLELASKEMQIKFMERHIEQLRKKIAERRGQKEVSVKKRVERLMQEDDDWDW